MATIQGLYVAFFGRPADPLGLAFFNAATANGANLGAMGPLDKSAEFDARFAGQSTTQIINAIHRSLFDRNADLPSVTSLANELAAGILTMNGLAATLIDGARGDDLVVLNTKLAAANAFTAAIDTTAEIKGYAGAAAALVGRTFLSSVSTTIPSAATIDNAVTRAAGTADIVLLVNRPLDTRGELLTMSAADPDVISLDGSLAATPILSPPSPAVHDVGQAPWADRSLGESGIIPIMQSSGATSVDGAQSSPDIAMDLTGIDAWSLAASSASALWIG